ncbi:hypothetical protein R6Z07M_014248 [Ovis aries]
MEITWQPQNASWAGLARVVPEGLLAHALGERPPFASPHWSTETYLASRARPPGPTKGAGGTGKAGRTRKAQSVARTRTHARTPGLAGRQARARARPAPRHRLAHSAGWAAAAAAVELKRCVCGPRQVLGDSEGRRRRRLPVCVEEPCSPALLHRRALQGPRELGAGPSSSLFVNRLERRRSGRSLG